MRLFTAIDLPSAMLEKLREFMARLRPLAKLHWSDVENLHITTKFIGEWPEARMQEMNAALRTVDVKVFEVAVRGVGWFPNETNPRVFWAGVEGRKPLEALARATEQAVFELGVPLETRVYSPHLTLARAKDSVRMDEIISGSGDPDFGAFEPSSFFLYVSSNGKYSKLEEFPLS